MRTKNQSLDRAFSKARGVSGRSPEQSPDLRPQSAGATLGRPRRIVDPSIFPQSFPQLWGILFGFVWKKSVLVKNPQDCGKFEQNFPQPLSGKNGVIRGFLGQKAFFCGKIRKKPKISHRVSRNCGKNAQKNIFQKLLRTQSRLDKKTGA